MFFQEFLNILLLNCSVEVLFSFHRFFFSFEKFISVQEEKIHINLMQGKKQNNLEIILFDDWDRTLGLEEKQSNNAILA